LVFNLKMENNNEQTQNSTQTEVEPTYRYATLMETNGKHSESWYYFIRYEGNEDALKHLNKQLEKVEFLILDDLSTFDLEMNYLVSERTAKEMSKIEVNSVMFHRKFDGKLQTIDFGFKKKDSNRKRIVKCFKVLGLGLIENFIDKEDIDPEDLAGSSESDQFSDDYNYSSSEPESE